MAVYGTREEMATNTFHPLKAGSYYAEVKSVEAKEMKAFNGDDVIGIDIKLTPLEADAKNPKIFNIEGEEVAPGAQTIFFSISNPTMGFANNNTTPSKLRGFLAALQNVDPNGAIDGPDSLESEVVSEYLQDYVGSQLIVTVAVAETSTGRTKNKILLFRPSDQEITPERVAETKKSVAPKAAKEEDSGAPEEAPEAPAAKPVAQKAATGKPTRKPLF